MMLIRPLTPVGLWTGVGHSPSQLPASEIKQTFLSSNLACLLAFEWRADLYTHTYLSATTEEGRDEGSENAPEGCAEVINQGGQTKEGRKFGSNGADVLRKER